MVICILYFCTYTLKIVNCLIPGCNTSYAQDVKKQKTIELKNKFIYSTQSTKKIKTKYLNIIYEQ